MICTNTMFFSISEIGLNLNHSISIQFVTIDKHSDSVGDQAGLTGVQLFKTQFMCGKLTHYCPTNQQSPIA